MRLKAPPPRSDAREPRDTKSLRLPTQTSQQRLLFDQRVKKTFREWITTTTRKRSHENTKRKRSLHTLYTSTRLPRRKIGKQSFAMLPSPRNAGKVQWQPTSAS